MRRRADEATFPCAAEGVRRIVGFGMAAMTPRNTSTATVRRHRFPFVFLSTPMGKGIETPFERKRRLDASETKGKRGWIEDGPRAVGREEDRPRTVWIGGSDRISTASETHPRELERIGCESCIPSERRGRMQRCNTKPRGETTGKRAAMDARAMKEGGRLASARSETTGMCVRNQRNVKEG